MVISLIAVSAIVSIIALNYSEEFATDIAHLECPLIKAGGGEMNFDAAVKFFGPVSYARLRHDWVNQKVLLHFIDDKDTSEDGLVGPIYLDVTTLTYSGYDYGDQRYRHFDRETLIYRSEHREFSNSPEDWYFERECRKISEDEFEKKRLRHANITRARQKI